MVATAAEILHEQDFEAEDQVEVVVGHDRIVRINIDGVCALRIRMLAHCAFDQVVPEDWNG